MEKKALDKPLKKRDKESLTGWKVARDRLVAERKTVAADLEVAKVDAAAKKAEAEEKEQRAAEKKQLEADEKRAMSEAGVIALVNDKISYDAEFDNNSDTAAATWERIHSKFCKRVHTGELPETDRRCVAALRRKCARAEQRHCLAQRRRQSRQSRIPRIPRKGWLVDGLARATSVHSSGARRGPGRAHSNSPPKGPL